MKAFIPFSFANSAIARYWTKKRKEGNVRLQQQTVEEVADKLNAMQSRLKK